MCAETPYFRMLFVDIMAVINTAAVIISQDWSSVTTCSRKLLLFSPKISVEVLCLDIFFQNLTINTNVLIFIFVSFSGLFIFITFCFNSQRPRSPENTKS